MAFFSREFKRHARNSLEMFLLTMIVMAFGIGLTFVEEWCETHHRPAYVVVTVGVLAAAVLITDSLVVFGVCLKLIRHVVHDLLSHRRRH